MDQAFVHLHVHTEYSITDGIVRIHPLLRQITSMGMPAVAITDLTNLFGMVKFYKATLAYGVKPIIGTEIWLENHQDNQAPFHLVLLCQNQQGYHNLTRLISRAYLEGQQFDKPILKRNWFKDHCEGLIALSAGLHGDIGQALLNNNHSLAKKYLQQWLILFPNRFYLELQRTGRHDEERYIQEVLKLASDFQVPVVATNDVCFLKQDDYGAHEARVCINGGWLLNDQRRPRNYSEQQYLRSPQEMVELFSDIPGAIENTVEIAKRCNLMLSLGTNYLPEFPVPDDISIENYLEQQSKNGLEERLSLLFDLQSQDFSEKRKPYDDRLQRELDVINQMGFPGYFLIVADFIQWAKQNGIPVGPGRGSGAGSLVAYALNITDIDPLKYDLLFERFLNPERVSMPDFDIDFCIDGRDRVIEYVSEKYGKERVSQIITYGSMAARAVVRDVGRVLGHPYGFVDTIAKLIPFELGITLGKALDDEEVLRERYEQEEEVRYLIDLAKKLEGIKRNVGKHAGGLVIAPSLLTDFTPLYCESGGANLVTQFDKEDVEAVGLVKFDFLGLRNLTIINHAVQTINAYLKASGKPLINLSTIPMHDPKTFALLKACQTTAVFQLESRGMKDLVKRLQPDRFEDLLALVALFRPGPLQSGMVDDFINRKHGRALVEYPHEKLKPILSATYGVILYQEQVMQIAQVLAGYSLGSADILRKAMGKKKPEEMARQRTIFVKGAIENGVKAERATHIFDLMEKFAGYGFNKSHSAAYALIAYQTAWLKAHYPAEFMSAVLSSDMDNTDKVVIFVDECYSMHIEVCPPNINSSDYAFIVKDGKILYGLGAIKGVGEAAIEIVVASRKDDGLFKDLFDFCQRIDMRKVNKRVVEALIKAGAMDALGPHRAALLECLNDTMLAAEQHLQDQAGGQNDLFGSLNDDSTGFKPEYERIKEWDKSERLQGEKETLGLYLSGHPIEEYERELQHIVSHKLSNLHITQDQTVTVGGLIVAIRVMNTKRGDRMAFISLNDRTGRIEVAVFSDVYETCRELLEKDQLIIVEGDASVDEYTGGIRVSAKKIMSIDQARETFAKHLLIVVHEKDIPKGFVEKLRFVLKPYRGWNCPVCLAYSSGNAKAMIPLGSGWRVNPTDDLLKRLRSYFPKCQVDVCY